MKKLFYIFASLLGGLILLAGCQEDGKLFDKSNGQFRFGVSSKVLTRTEYGDYNKADKHQDINWTADDQIRIYSPTAARRVGVEKGLAADQRYYWADYKIIPDKNDPTKATIENINNDGGYKASQVGTNVNGNPDLGNGLAWERGKESDPHTFYAISPLNGNSVPTDGTGKEIDGAKGTFADLPIPTPQVFSVKGNLSQYGYMTACAQGKGTDKNINLDFYPAFTAFEISIRSADAATELTEFKLIAADGAPAINGKFTVNYDAAGNRTQDCSSAGNGREITVNLAGRVAPAASTNTDLVFTVLALPQDLTGLSVQFTYAGVTRKLALNYADDYTGTDDNGQSLGGKPVTFTACNKHRIYGLVLPNNELLISVGTADWVENTESTYSTIEDVETLFLSYKRWNEQHFYEGTPSWYPPYYNYVAIAPGRSNEQINIGTEEDPEYAASNRPLYSTMITMTTVSVGVPLQLRSDNPNVGFVVAGENGVYSATPSQTLDIRASESWQDEVETTYFVVPVGDAAVGQTANITLVRMDASYAGTPIAFSHKDMPGTTDHTKVPYKVLSVADYNNNTHEETPSI